MGACKAVGFHEELPGAPVNVHGGSLKVLGGSWKAHAAPKGLSLGTYAGIVEESRGGTPQRVLGIPHT